MTDKKKAYEWDFCGDCAPGIGRYEMTAQRTFSLGIFQWIPRVGAFDDRLKKGKVVMRIKGKVKDAERVIARAKAECARLNAEEAKR